MSDNWCQFLIIYVLSFKISNHDSLGIGQYESFKNLRKPWPHWSSVDRRGILVVKRCCRSNFRPLFSLPFLHELFCGFQHPSQAFSQFFPDIPLSCQQPLKNQMIFKIKSKFSWKNTLMFLPFRISSICFLWRGTIKKKKTIQTRAAIPSEIKSICQTSRISIW